MSHPLLARLGAEAAGTALLVGLGTAAVVATAHVGSGRFVLLAVAWFAAVTIPVLAFAGISGAHLNPYVTAALVIDRRVPPRELAPHWAAQFAGAFLASGLVLAAYGGPSGLGATVPTAGAIATCLLGEFAFTLALLLVVLMLVRRGDGRGHWGLLTPGAVVAVSTYVIGPWSGSSLNLARTLAPAVLAGSYSAIWVYFVAGPAAVVAAAVVARLADGRGTRARAK